MSHLCSQMVPTKHSVSHQNTVNYFPIQLKCPINTPWCPVKTCHIVPSKHSRLSHQNTLCHIFWRKDSAPFNA